MIDMSAYGLGERFSVLAAQYPQHLCARVVAQDKGLYKIVSHMGEQNAVISGKLRNDTVSATELPAVGDFVMVDGNGGDTAVIHIVLPRKSVFVRKAAGTGREGQTVAANIDLLFLCMSLNSDFNLRRLERYLSIAWDSGAAPVVVLTKADLCGDTQAKIAEIESVALGADILLCSSMEEDGTAQLLPYLKPGLTIALIGSSGVGKSTLINRLLGEERIATREIRSGDDKGRHTTTRRELLTLPGGLAVIDTPGMRELGMWDSGEGVSTAFADIEELAGRCRYKDCTHSGEPGCAVAAALAVGTLSEGRFQSYCKLKRESKYAEDSESYMAAKKAKFKNIALANKQNRKK